MDSIDRFLMIAAVIVLAFISGFTHYEVSKSREYIKEHRAAINKLKEDIMAYATLQKSAVDAAVLEGNLVFIVPSANGHDRLVWDASDPEQVKEAIEKFDEYMEKGYIAYTVDDEGNQSHVVNKNDWRRRDIRQKEELLFVLDPVTGKKKPKEARVMAPVVGG